MLFKAVIDKITAVQELSDYESTVKGTRARVRRRIVSIAVSHPDDVGSLFADDRR